LFKFHKRGRREGGQTLILVVVALPLFVALMALVVDGGNILVHKRNIQVAADAAALAIAQNIDLASSPHTCGTYNGQTGNPACNTLAAEYTSKNGVNASIHKCNDADPTHPTDTNCWAYPYVDTHNVTHDDEVEVRLQAPVTTFFVGAADALLKGGVGATFKVSARAVAQTDQVLGVSTIPGQTYTGSTTVVSGGTHTTTDPDVLSGGSGVAFTMSRSCTAISYTGAGPKGGEVLGAFATNGGLDFPGAAPKKMTWLAYNQTACPSNPARPPSGTNQCTAVAWGDATDSGNKCVKTLVGLHNLVNWPVVPPTLPTPKTGANSGTWVPSTDYASKCINIAGGSFNVSSQPAGIYCVSGAGVNLTIQGVEPAGGDGHTFFGLNGATLSVASNGSVLKFYWPSACGSRPTTRPASVTCFGNTINVSVYDAMTLLDSTNTAGSSCAICLSGQGNSLTGDIFAPKAAGPNPDVFPPSPTDTGGFVSINGGALSAGSGFIESWLLEMAGNTGSYTGTGTSLVIPGQTRTTTDPSTTIIVPGSTGNATTVATTLGTTLDLSQ